MFIGMYATTVKFSPTATSIQWPLQLFYPGTVHTFTLILPSLTTTSPQHQQLGRGRVQWVCTPLPHEMKLSSSYSLFKFVYLPVSDVIPQRCTPLKKDPGSAPEKNLPTMTSVITDKWCIQNLICELVLNLCFCLVSDLQIYYESEDKNVVPVK